MMRSRGLRSQLCLWHAAVMALTLLALAIFTYVLLIRVLHSRADAALIEQADTTARQIAATLYRGSVVGTAEAPVSGFLNNDLRSWGRYLQVIDRQGNIYEKSDGLQSHPLPVSVGALRRGLAGQVTLETVTGLGEHPVRVVTVPVRQGERIPFLVLAGTSLEGVEGALQRAGWVLMILTPSVFLLALVGGWLLVGRALRRVDLLTQTAIEIQSSNLRRRMAPDAPDDEIGRLSRAFDQMIARLDRSFQQVRQFSADASHELKTPLTAIRGEAEVALMSDLSTQEYRTAIGSMLESAERMSHVVESLLLLSRADAGQNLLQQGRVGLGGLVLQVVESVETMAARSQVSVELGEVEDLEVLGDGLWLGQILSNLITNGIKYTLPGGRVTVDLMQKGSEALLTVRDSGIGIPSEHLPHIFDRFYRVDEGRARSVGGAGLGLSITRWAVEAHGGAIEVQSVPGQGSAFQVRLPLSPPASTPGH
jgi:two-component system, OmpR family, sensor kinase